MLSACKINTLHTLLLVCLQATPTQVKKVFPQMLSKYLLRGSVFFDCCSRQPQVKILNSHYEPIKARLFITFCKTRGKKKRSCCIHSLAPALNLTLALTLALILTFNHLANELISLLYGLMYLTYGSAAEHEYLTT